MRERCRPTEQPTEDLHERVPRLVRWRVEGIERYEARPSASRVRAAAGGAIGIIRRSPDAGVVLAPVLVGDDRVAALRDSAGASLPCRNEDSIDDQILRVPNKEPNVSIGLCRHVDVDGSCRVAEQLGLFVVLECKGAVRGRR